MSSVRHFCSTACLCAALWPLSHATVTCFISVYQPAVSPAPRKHVLHCFHISPQYLIFSSVAQSCLTLCNPMDSSMPGFSVHHQHLELIQTHVHWVGDAIQPSHPLSKWHPLKWHPLSFLVREDKADLKYSEHRSGKKEAMGSLGQIQACCEFVMINNSKVDREGDKAMEKSEGSWEDVRSAQL